MGRKERTTLKERDNTSAFPCLLIPSRMEVGSRFPRKFGGVGGYFTLQAGGWGGVATCPLSSMPAGALTCDTGSSNQRSSLRRCDPEGAGHRRLLPGQQSQGQEWRPAPRRPAASLRPPALQGLAASPSAVHLRLPGLPLSPASGFSHTPVHLWATAEPPAFLAC